MVPHRTFPTFTADLHELANWLKECQVTTVAMESTGVYWIPVHQILEAHGFEVVLVNAPVSTLGKVRYPRAPVWPRRRPLAAAANPGVRSRP